MLALHGDDALYGGDNEFYKDVIKPMKAKLKLEKRMEDEYRVLDWNVEQDQGNIYVSQEDFVKNRFEWLKIEQNGNHEATTKLTDDNKAKLRQHIERIRWVFDQSRLDVSFEELKLSTAIGNPTVKEWNKVNEVIKSIKENEVQISPPD